MPHLPQVAALGRPRAAKRRRVALRRRPLRQRRLQTPAAAGAAAVRMRPLLQLTQLTRALARPPPCDVMYEGRPLVAVNITVALCRRAQTRVAARRRCAGTGSG